MHGESAGGRSIDERWRGRADTGSGQAPSLRGMTLLALCVCAALAWWHAVEAPREADAAARATLQHAARSASEQAALVVQFADALLRGHRQRLRHDGDFRTVDARLASPILDGSSPWRLSLVDAHGPATASTSQPEIDMATRINLLRAHPLRQPPLDRLEVSLSLCDDRRVCAVHFSRPVFGTGGSLRGLVVLSVPAVTLSAAYRRLDLGIDGVMILAFRNGSALAWSGDKDAPNQDDAAPWDLSRVPVDGFGDSGIMADPQRNSRIWADEAVADTGLRLYVASTREHLLKASFPWAVPGLLSLALPLVAAAAWVAGIAGGRRRLFRSPDGPPRHSQASAPADPDPSSILDQVAHELRTPLHGLIGSLELLCLEPGMHDRDFLLETASRSAYQLRAAIELLLELAALRARRRSPVGAAGHSVQALMASLPEHAAQLEASGIPMSWHLAGDMPDPSPSVHAAWEQMACVLLSEASLYRGCSRVDVKLEALPDGLDCFFSVEAFCDAAVQTTDTARSMPLDAGQSLHESLLIELGRAGGITIQERREGDFTRRTVLLVPLAAHT